MGVPMYGQSYRLSLASNFNLGDRAAGPGTPGEYTRQPGMLAYYEICERVKKRNWKVGLSKIHSSFSTNILHFSTFFFKLFCFRHLCTL